MITIEKEAIISSIKNIYNNVNVPIILCDQEINAIWSNIKAQKSFNNLTLDLFLSKNNIDSIKKLIKENKYGYIESSFLPSMGNKINITPIKHDNFTLILLTIENEENKKGKNNNSVDNANQIIIDQILAKLSSSLRLPLHILNNSLNTINNEIENIDKKNKKNLSKTIHSMEKHTNKMTRLCDNLTELIRFSTNTNSINKSMIILSEYINNLMQTCIKYIKMRNLKPHYKYTYNAETVVLMNLDCEKFDVAIANIILNSCLYSYENKNIYIDVNIDDQYLTIIIKDEGFGISKENIKDVFRPYTSIKSKNFNEETIGIGLTLAKYIILQHQGTIDIDSIEGVGTTVTVQIPIIIEEPEDLLKLSSPKNQDNSYIFKIQFSPISLISSI